MAKGLDKDIAKRYGISKKAWVEQRKRNRTGKKTKTVKKRSAPKKTRRKTVARKRKRSRKRKFTIPVAIVAPIAWKFMSAAQKAKSGDWEGAGNDLLWHFAGIQSKPYKFNPEALKTWIPVIVGAAIHIAASKLGINRYLGRAGIPIIRI